MASGCEFVKMHRLPVWVLAFDFVWLSSRIIFEIVRKIFFGRLTVACFIYEVPVWVSTIVASCNAVSEFSKFNVYSWFSKIVVDQWFILVRQIIHFRWFFFSQTVINFLQILMANTTIKTDPFEPSRFDQSTALSDVDSSCWSFFDERRFGWF